MEFANLVREYNQVTNSINAQLKEHRNRKYNHRVDSVREYSLQENDILKMKIGIMTVLCDASNRHVFNLLTVYGPAATINNIQDYWMVHLKEVKLAMLRRNNKRGIKPVTGGHVSLKVSD